MSSKRTLNHDYRRLIKIRPSYLLVPALCFLVLGIYGARHNYSHMASLRQAVEVADQQNGDVEGALRELREFVYAHMNTNLSSGNVAIKPPIQLKYRYERLAKAEETKVKSYNEAVKRRGEQICGARFPAGGYNSPRVACVAEYVRVNSKDAKPVPSDLYKFDFISPGWSPDLAGVSLLVSFLLFTLLLIRLAAGVWYRAKLD